MSDDESLDLAVRLAAFRFLREATERLGEVLSWSLLTDGFLFESERVCLIGQHGIWKPRILPRMPLSITTAPASAGRQAPYDDSLDAEGLLTYRYRGIDPDHYDNVGLRMAMARRVPLIYMFGVVEGHYMPAWPVYIVGEPPEEMAFKVAVDERLMATRDALIEMPDIADGRRSYVTRVTLQRLHQATFRERVLRAYRGHCAICRLHHVELLDAAHILPDGHPRGEAVVPNGLALCKLHHAAFDRQILGIRPDLVIEVRRDILQEEDGPMLKYGLQQLEGKLLAIVPRAATQRPGRAFLEERYELFRSAG